jgi:hypothetical protein
VAEPSRVEVIIEWLRKNADHIERPHGSLAIDWGEHDITFKPGWLDRVSTRPQRSERLAS